MMEHAWNWDECVACHQERNSVTEMTLCPGARSTPDSASTLLTHAASLVAGDRAAQHGPKERNHQNIADHWNAYLGGRLTTPLTALDVALMMVELKVARTKAGSGRSLRDNYVDMAGYAGVAGEIALNGKEVP
jgi:hypothetical protein